MNVRRFCQQISLPFSRILPLEKLLSVTGQYLVLPFYHAVSDQKLPHLEYLMKLRDTAAFKSDLDFLQKNFVPVSAEDLMEVIKGERMLSRPAFHLSFDDGLKEMATIVAPVLKERGIPATFFINTGFIGNREIFYRYKASLLSGKLKNVPENARKQTMEKLDECGIIKGNLKKRLLSVTYSERIVLDKIAELMEFDFREYAAEHNIYLDEDDIRDLIRQGFSVGAHSIDHPEYRKIPMEEQVRQTLRSLEYMIERFQVTPSLFSFPFSDDEVTSAFFAKMHKPEGIADLSFGMSGLKNDTAEGHLHRIPMECGTVTAQQIIVGEYLYFVLKSVINKNKIIRK